MPGGTPGGVVGGIVAPTAVPPPPAMADLMRTMDSGTTAQRAGEQFEYRVRQPVTVRRNQSALLPIIQAEVEGEKVSVYNESGGNRPRHAVWLKNTSGFTLDSGSFTVLETNAFAGEGLTDVIHANEQRLLSYGLDLGTTVTSNRSPGKSRLLKVEVAGGVATVNSRQDETKTYIVRNNARSHTPS